MDRSPSFAAAVALARERWPEAVVGVRSPNGIDDGGEVRLMPGFEEAADYLRAELSGVVAVRVGFFPYPMTGAERRLDWADFLPRLDDRVELSSAGPLVVSAGRSTRLEVALLNRGSTPVVTIGSEPFQTLLGPEAT